MKRRVRDLAVFAFFAGWLAPLLICIGLILNNVHALGVVPLVPPNATFQFDSADLLMARSLFRVVVLWVLMATAVAVAFLLFRSRSNDSGSLSFTQQRLSLIG